MLKNPIIEFIFSRTPFKVLMNMNWNHHLSFFLLFLISPSLLIGQGIAPSPQETKNSIAEVKLQYDKERSSEKILSLRISNQEQQYLRSSHQNLNLKLPKQFGGDVLLERVSLFSDNFRFIQSSGDQLPLPKQLFTYRGRLDKDPNSTAFLTVNQGSFHLMVNSEKGTLEVHPEGGNSYKAYYLKDINKDKKIECFTDENKIAVSKKNASQRMSGDCLELYIEVDHQAYQDQGSSSANTLSWVANITNPVIGYFRTAGIPLVISEIFVWTSQDPLNGGNSLDVLNQFKNLRGNNYNGRIASLLSTRALGGGIADGIGGFCGSAPSSPGPYAVCGDLESSISGLPTYNYSVNLLSHELGHVMGARHTHACVWNGNNTQIDDCGNVYANQQGNFPEGAACYDALNPIPDPANGGTIMSRCDLLSVGIDLSLGFHQQVAQVIVNNYVNASCQTGVVCSTIEPSNNDCSNSTTIIPKSACFPETYDNIMARPSGINPGFSCGNIGSGSDVWFNLTVPSSGNITIETTQISGGLSNTVTQVYSGSCGNLQQVACDDNSGNANHTLISLTGRTIGETLYVRIVDSGGDDEGTFGLCAYDASIPCHPAINDLLTFYNATGGISWTNRLGWESGNQGNDCDICNWYGITCNAQDEVIRIELANNNLINSIPTIIGALPKLELLDLSNNSITGNLPSELNQILDIVLLDLSDNNLSGTINIDLNTLSNLAVIYLENNNLTGNIPSGLGNNQINILHLNDNNLSGCIPVSFDVLCPDKDVLLTGNSSLSGGNFNLFCSEGLGGDFDSDGFCAGSGPGEDCLDDDPLSFPGATETCDGIDNDCNGVTDDMVSSNNTWTGGGNSDWYTGSNWSLNVVPAPCHDVTIDNVSVTISNSGIATARSIQLNGTATLLNDGSLEVKGSTSDGINVSLSSTFTNNGYILIDDAQQHGLHLLGAGSNTDSLEIGTNNGSASIRIQANGSFQNTGTGKIILKE